MKKIRSALAYVLLLAMLLSSMGGFAFGAGENIVSVGEQLAFDPLAETQSVAYERHDAGYEVTLDRAADGVTMRVTAVPKTVSAEGAALYIRTGVAPKAGKTYRVSYTLASEKALDEYAVCFDGTEENAYGTAEKRSVATGGTDLARCFLTPEAESGELILRLQLGKTPVNTLRFSGLTVEEATEEEVAAGANTVLVDKLNLNAPGSVSMWTNDDCGAQLTAEGETATLTVTDVPRSGAEVWKIKLLTHTGVRPEPGKTYRFRATLNSTNSGSYEACYNEGEVEKGYDVLYNQSLKSGSQTVERMIYVPTDKENPGELIVQFSLGKLSKGTKVTISKVTVEEASPAYTNALAKDFALDTTDRFEAYDPNNLIVTGSTEVGTSIGWTCPAVVTADNWEDTGGLTTGMDIIEDKAVINIKHGIGGEGHGCWESKLIINTDTAVETTKFYRVSFTMNSTQPYSGDNKFEVLLGDGAGSEACAAFKSLILEANEDTPLAFSFKPSTSVDSLFVTLQIGTKNGDARTVTISNFKLEEVAEGVEETLDLSSSLTYPTANQATYSLEGWDKSTGIASTEGGAIKLKVTTGHDYADPVTLRFNTGFTPSDNETYVVSFKIKAIDSPTSDWEIFYGKAGTGDDDHFYGGKWPGTDAWSSPAIPKDAFAEVKQEISKETGNANLLVDLRLGKVPNTYLIKDFEVKIKDGATQSSQPDFGTFSINTLYDRDAGGALVGDGSSATLKPFGGWFGAYKRELFANNITGGDLIAGDLYTVGFDITTSDTHHYVAHYSRGNIEGGFGTKDVSDHPSSLSHSFMAYAQGILTLQLQLGELNGNDYTISNITVKHTPYTPVSGSPLVSGFSSVGYVNYSNDKHTENRENVSLARNPGSAQLTVERNPGYESTAMANFYAQLKIRTGVMYEPGADYQIKFDISANHPQKEFVVLWEGVPDTEDLRGTWGQSIDSINTVKTITTRALPARLTPDGEIAFRIELGNLDAGVPSNTFTVSNVRVYKVSLTMALKEARVTGTVTNDMQEGYSVPLTRAKDSATVAINKTPSSGMEAWKHKLFIDTGVNVNEGEAYRVVFDTLAENDMDFEVCYNRGSTEKGFTAVYGLHAAAGKTKTVEKMVFAENSGKLIVQLSLGNVPAPNKVTVSNLRVERIKYTYSGKSALPAEISYQAGDVSYWAHADYTTELTGTDDAITMHVLKAPGFGAEPWKIKLFLDTATPLEPGKFYRITTDLVAKSPQNVEICYNSGGVEMGYDSMGGIRLAAGVKQTVEKLISVPTDKTDGKNLMLQVNLGAATSPNEITVSGITVEEVSLRYADLMPQNFSYQKHSTVRTSPDINAKLETTTGTASICITDAPATGAEVWMAQLLVRTGVVLTAGKSYVVRANLVSDKDLTYELCFNNEETEKGFDVLYGQFAHANTAETIDKKISVPAGMTDAGELVLQFSVGGPGANNVTVANVSVQELRYGTNGAKDLTPAAAVEQQGTLDLHVSREAVTGRVNGRDGAIRVTGAALCAGEQYEAAFTGKADAALSGTLTLRRAGAAEPVMTQRFTLSPEAQAFAFTTGQALDEDGAYELLWQFEGSGTVELSDITLSIPAEELIVKHVDQKVTVNGAEAAPDVYEINGENYFRLRDLAMLLNDTLAQFVVRYNSQNQTVSVTTGKRYSPVGGELERGADRSASCARGTRSLLVDGKAVSLKAYNLGSNNYFRLADLDDTLGFRTDYIEAADIVAITSPLTPEAQEASYAYGTFFRPEIDSESQPYVGDPMAYYEDGVYYIYYLKEGGDSVNHSVYLTTTSDFASYTEIDKPVLAASRGDAQDSWIGTGSVTKVDGTYYFFYTGYNSSGAREYHEKIMVAKGSSPTSFEKVSGWEITPPASLGQKNDFRDPQAYYDPATGKISLTVTASQGGVARILKYTLNKDLTNAQYDGIIFTDPSGKYWNLECSDTFRLGDKWYLTYSGQEDTLWYAAADSRFGPYSEPVQLDGKVFYAAKHVEDGKNSYMVGWARRSETASSTQEVAAWGGNLAVQKLTQRADGSLALAPVDSVAASFGKPAAVTAESISLSAGSDYSFKQVCTSAESFKLTGEFTSNGTGTFGLAFDFNGKEESYKLISVDPKERTLSLAFNEGVTKIAETPAELGTKHSFTYIQDGSVGIFYVDGVASLTVRVYGSTGKPVYLFAQDGSVSFTSLRCFAK